MQAVTTRALCAARRILTLLAVLAVALLAAGCAATKPSQGALDDLVRLPQRVAAYVDPATADTPLIPCEQAEALAREFQGAHFAPWLRTAPAYGPDKVFAFLDRPRLTRYVEENLAHLSAPRLAELRKNCDLAGYPNSGLHAITVRGTSMRELPTDRPLFKRPSLPGEGYPFDYLQNSQVWAQTPLYVSHLSSDGAWALCESRFSYGWIPIQDIALVDEDFMAAFETGRYLTFTQDRVPLADDFGLYRFQGRVGMLLPLIGQEDGGSQALMAVRDDMGRARLRSTTVPSGAADLFPLSPSPANFARLADALMGQPYGWGGMYGHRDCSALVMDIYAAFGLNLPRNSTKQSKSGDFVSFKGLADAAKAQLIADAARPWLTLIWKPGHIMVYLGLRDGEPVILHATWGLKTMIRGREGRRLIGAVVVTSLAPGDELPELVRPDGVLLHKLGGMTFVAPAPGPDSLATAPAGSASSPGD
ncbi:SH3 domain-containing protein [Desulfocurvus sp. DL9XJH121]